MRCGGLWAASHQPNLFPRLSTLAKLYAADRWVILDDVQFVRRDYQHRCLVGPPGDLVGQQWLTLPVHLVHGRATKINDISIVDPRSCRRRVEGMLTQTYSRAPHWSRIRDVVHEIGDLIAKTDRLDDIAVASTKVLLDLIEWPGLAVRSSCFHVCQDRTRRLADLTERVDATTYLCGTGGATAAQYTDPLWNSWGQFYTSVSQDNTLAWAKGLHDAGVPGHTIQVDDGWMSHYGDFTFNGKFPDPKELSDQIHALGYDFGLWVTLWINNDADNYAYAADHGYLLKSKSDPSEPCDVSWWNGTAGIVDLANPDAKAWYEGKLRELEQTYGVDGFKFDTRFFDESCAPYPGHTALDYLTLGAQLTDEFDQQGAGVRISWTGSQQYGFVIRQVDKGTGWDSLQAAVSQDLSISTIGYPFVETDMVGGSLSQPPPTKEVLVRWAQAASLMPLMYSSTSPLGVSSPAGSQQYDQQTVDLYSAAVKRHERLSPYVQRQVSRAVRTGEPIMKPLFFDYPGDQATYTVDDEWLLGDSLLAAPVVTDAGSRDVHLPPGHWYDVAHRRVVKGGTTLTGYSADLTTTPMFVRLGTRDTGTLLRALANR